ncbi:hypothetical protein CHS0354_014717 [Potamilus streckersoni]|uniref:C2H2-type domain-containing protein n=1 Tax=Potamilus streckersoni TaxID=2493646 RepID=A0AAE0SPZ1_9BIVA|nr:hypothetical protein CHS0354_014717 [Potamilus streckersoni]
MVHVEYKMESYLILLYVTVEQENAIQALFKQQDWLYSRMKFTKNDNKEDGSDLASPRNRLYSYHSGSLESSMELSSFSQALGSNCKRTAKDMCCIYQIGSLESEVQSACDKNESNFKNITKKIFSINKGDDEVANVFHVSSSLHKVTCSSQLKEFDEVRIDDSIFHEGGSNFKCHQVDKSSKSLRSCAQDSCNCDRINDKYGGDDPDQLSYEIQVKHEGDDLNSTQPKIHAYGGLLGICPEQSQVNVATHMFQAPTSVTVTEYFDKFQRETAFSRKETLRRVYQHKSRVLEQNNEDKRTLENQGKGETFKQQKSSPPLNKETKVGRKKGKGFTRKMKGTVLKHCSSDHNNRCEKMILENSDPKKHLKEISQDRTEHNVTSHTNTGNLGKTESDCNKHIESMTLENSSGHNESFSDISEQRTVLGLEEIQTDHTITDSVKNSAVLTESNFNVANNGKSKMEKERIFCDDCKESFKLAGKFRRHKRDGKCVFHCEFCGKRYISKDYASFMVHRRYHMDSRPYKCEICNKAYKFEYKLKVHIRNHTGERPWVCEVCGARFMAPFNLKQHKLAIHSDEMHICDICGVKLCNKGYLEWHKKFVHSTERPFTCPTCGKSFKSKQNLKNHKVVHDEALAFACDICSKRFKTKTRLNYHVRRHQNDRRYQCETCGKGFYCTKSLREHQMIHSGVKPYKCQTCEYRCTQKGNLDKHMKIHLSK